MYKNIKIKIKTGIQGKTPTEIIKIMSIIDLFKTRLYFCQLFQKICHDIKRITNQPFLKLTLEDLN